MATSLQAGAAEEPIGSVPQSAPARDPIAGFIAEAAQRFGIAANWVRAVIKAESDGDAAAVSPRGAMGLMQIMPETWSDLRERYGLGPHPFDPRDNILAGAAYLRELHDRYGDAGFLAAYNAGPARYEDHLATGRPLPTETLAYLATLAPMITGASSGGARIDTAVRSWSDAPLFASNTISSAAKIPASSNFSPPDRRPIDISAEDRTGLTPQSTGLFVDRFHAGSGQ